MEPVWRELFLSPGELHSQQLVRTGTRDGPKQFTEGAKSCGLAQSDLADCCVPGDGLCRVFMEEGNAVKWLSLNSLVCHLPVLTQHRQG